MISATLWNLVNFLTILFEGMLASKISDKITGIYEPNMRIWVSSSPTITGERFRRIVWLMLNLMVFLMVVAIIILITGIIFEIVL